MENYKLLATVHDNGTVIVSVQAEKDIVVLEFPGPYSVEIAADESKYLKFDKGLLYQYRSNLALTKNQPTMYDYVNSLAALMGYTLVKDSHVAEILPKIQW
jgi:hypothetical protein